MTEVHRRTLAFYELLSNGRTKIRTSSTIQCIYTSPSTLYESFKGRFRGHISSWLNLLELRHLLYLWAFCPADFRMTCLIKFPPHGLDPSQQQEMQHVQGNCGQPRARAEPDFQRDQGKKPSASKILLLNQSVSQKALATLAQSASRRVGIVKCCLPVIRRRRLSGIYCNQCACADFSSCPLAPQV